MARCVDPPQGWRYIKRMAKDVDLFRAAMAGVTPLKRSRAPVIPKPKAERPSMPQEEFTAPLGGPASPVAAPGIADQTFDRDVDRALSKGRRAPEARLDLHGMTLDRRRTRGGAFHRRLGEQKSPRRLDRDRKGTAPRRRPRVRRPHPGGVPGLARTARRTGRGCAGVRPAHPRHGGSGAFYVLLRRRSSASSRSLRATPQR